MRAMRSIFGSTDEEDAALDATAPVVQPIEYLFGPENSQPTAPEPPPQGIRYERGSLVYAIDGPVGTLRQVVIDEDMAEVKALVVRLATKNESVLVPPDLVDRSADGALLLNVTKEQFALGASRSPRMEARMFTRANIKNVAKVIPIVFHGDRRRSVVNLSGDLVETGEALGQQSMPGSSPARRSPWKRFRRA
ncbi:MAG: hypothetical protein KY456_16970 [Chloroflexi bacterium]|nr:hypothetical protein [Chloroflexota bacterium]